MSSTNSACAYPKTRSLGGECSDAIAANGDNHKWGVALAIVGTFLFALKSILIKFAFAEGAEATLLLALRLFFSFPFYVAMLIHLRGKRKNSQPLCFRKVIAATCLGFLGYYLASFLDMAGLERISAQLERLTLFTYPAMIAVLARLFLGETLSLRIVASIVLSYVGIALMYSQESQTVATTGSPAIGVMLVLGSALSYSLYVILAKPMIQQMGSREFTSFAMIGSAGCIAVHFFLACDASALFSAAPIVYVYALAIAFVCTVLPSFCISEAIMRLGAARTTVIGSVGPVITIAIAIMVLREPTSAYHIVGMAIVIFGVSLVSRK
ncbi:MAG: DMT family transporter [Planctomycetales bacterium]|nr:DMT family transporter [Planctomycetales bacterium]